MVLKERQLKISCRTCCTSYYYRQCRSGTDIRLIRAEALNGQLVLKIVEFDLKGIVIIAGNYGSGKTEVAVNLAMNRKRAGMDVRIADLDLVNPYFRTREARGVLTQLGIDVVLPHEKYLNADLPMLVPEISGLIRQPGELALLDLGGDDVGATVLASLADAFKDRQVHMLQVVNPFRPFTDSIEGCLKIRAEIEKASRLTVSGIIGNANLIDETTVDDIYKGYDFVTSLSERSGLPLKFITAAVELLPVIDTKLFSCLVLPIHRQLVPPWKKPARVGTEHLILH